MPDDLTGFLISPPRRGVVKIAFREVREGQVRYLRLEEPEAVHVVIRLLGSLPRGHEKRVDELGLRYNVREWVELLITGKNPENEERVLGYLLNDFTDSMRFRMREAGMYAAAILVEHEYLVLIHSRYIGRIHAGRSDVYSILLAPESLLRYVWFTRDGVARFYERHKTRSLAEWLGLSAGEALRYYGVRIRIHVDIAGIPAVLELGEDEASSLIEQHPELLEDKINLAQPVATLRVRRIQVGRNRSYSSASEFIAEFQAMRHGLEYYRERCGKILGSLTPLLGRLIEDRERIYLAESGETIVEKPPVDIVLVCAARGRIELSSRLRDWIASRAVAWEPVGLLHVAEPLAREPLRIGPLILYNEVADTLAGVYASAAATVEDAYLRIPLLYAALRRLSSATPPDTLGYLLGEVADALARLAGKHFPGFHSMPVHVLYEETSVFLRGGGGGELRGFLRDFLEAARS